VKYISIFFHTVTPLFKHSILTSFSPGCYWLAVFLLKTARKQQQSSKPIRSWKESGMASIDHFTFKKIIKDTKKYFAEPLYTLCIFSFLEPHLCQVNRISGIGDDWLRK
jgi:hypothetical protein